MVMKYSLLGIVRITPLFPNIQESEVVATRFNEVLVCLLCVEFLVLRTEHESVAFLEH